MKMNRSVVCLVLLVIIDYVYTCTTPQGRNGQCVSLYDCPELLKAFQKSLTTEVKNFLRSSLCGFERTAPKVCCGPLPRTLSDVTTVKPSLRGTNTSVNQELKEDSSPAPQNECGEIQDVEDRIFGGDNTELKEFPWMALLGYKTRFETVEYECGGALINRRYVLTAAHCIRGKIESQYGKLITVRLGEYDTQKEEDCVLNVCAELPQEIDVAATYPHPDYSDKAVNRHDDIALIRLAKKALYTYSVQPICLVDNRARIGLGQTFFVAGWGKTLAGANSPIKRKLSVPIFDKNECVRKYRALGADLLDKQICAGGKFAEDSCSGDSGGPLMRKRPEGIWEAVGVVSFGHGCGRDGWPGVYTSIASYMDWIRSTLQSTNV